MFTSAQNTQAPVLVYTLHWNQANNLTSRIGIPNQEGVVSYSLGAGGGQQDSLPWRQESLPGEGGPDHPCQSISEFGVLHKLACYSSHVKLDGIAPLIADPSQCSSMQPNLSNGLNFWTKFTIWKSFRFRICVGRRSFFWTNEYPNTFITIHNGQMNIWIYLAW